MRAQLLLLSLCIFHLLVGISSQGCIGTVDGFSYDFTSLRDNAGDYIINAANGSRNPWQIRMNICGPLNSYGKPACKTGASACQNWDMPNPTFAATLGMASTLNVSLLRGSNGLPIGYSASFVGGVGIGNNPIISSYQLLCNSVDLMPTVISTSNGNFRFQWMTTAACTGSVPACAGAIDGISYDLTPLMNANTDYYVRTQATSINMNLCRDLVSESSGCLSGASACATNQGMNDTTLGIASTMDVSFIEEECEIAGIYASFTGGMNPQGEAVSMEIMFICVPDSGVGQPLLVSSTPTHYEFVWNNQYVCNLGYQMTKSQAYGTFTTIDRDGDEYLSLEEFNDYFVSH